jgi:hypothetical protein
MLLLTDCSLLPVLTLLFSAATPLKPYLNSLICEQKRFCYVLYPGNLNVKVQPAD